MSFTSFYIDRVARQWIFATVVLLVLFALTPDGLMFLKLPDFPFRAYMQFGASLVLVYFAYPVYADVKQEFAYRAFGSSTIYALVFAGTVLASITQLATLKPELSPHMQMGIVAWLLLTGHLVAFTSYPQLLSDSSALHSVRKAHITQFITFTMFIISIGTFVIWNTVFLVPILVSSMAALAVLISVQPSLYEHIITSLTGTLSRILKESDWTVSSMHAFISLHNIRTVVFDDVTGLITGSLRVRKVILLPHHANPDFIDNGEKTLLQYAAALETDPTHPVARSVNEYIKHLNISAISVSAVSVRTGKGVQGLIGTIAYVFGSKEYLQDEGVWNEEAEFMYEKARDEGLIPVFLADTGVIGAVLFSRHDISNARDTFAWLREKSIRVVAPVKKTANMTVAETLFEPDEIVRYESEEDILSTVKKISGQENPTLVVGSVRTSKSVYALAAVSMMVGAGNGDRGSVDIAVSQHDIEVVKDSMLLAMSSYRYISMLGVCVLGYAIVIIPVAAGAFIPSGVYVPFAYAAVLNVTVSAGSWILLHILQRSLYTKALQRYGTR